MMITQHYLTFPFYLPRIIALLDNWPLYLFNYLGRRKRPADYRLRDGFRLVDGRGSLAGTFAVVFVRREYGYPSQCRTIIDIGANMGCFTLFAAQLCPEAKILSFEPERKNFELLSKNIALNSLQKRVIPFNRAVAARAGHRNLAVGESPLNSLVSLPSGSGHQQVACTTLPEVLAEHALEKVDLLKMNCEGAEYEILEGCSDSDFERLPDIRFEYHNLSQPGRRGDALVRLLRGKGYNIERFTRYRDESGFIWARRS